jgi:integrator complex subunit 4
MHRALGCLYPEYRMRLAHEGIDEEVRLLDDAFVKICDMVNDVDVSVRTKACTIMASYQYVDPNVLSQTFSKQIMSHNKRKAQRGKGWGKRVVNVSNRDYVGHPSDCWKLMKWSYLSSTRVAK